MRIPLILFAAVVIIGGAFFLYKKAPQLQEAQVAESDMGPTPPADPHNQSDSAESQAKDAHGANPDAKPLPPAIKAFNYKQESQNLVELTKDWPKSKQKLLKNVLAPDLFKEHGIAAEPHTVSDIIYRQMGALKVASLRVLVENEASKEQKLKDLAYVAQAAKDETIKVIAAEARKAVKEDRPFFSVTVDAINNLEKAP